MAKNTVYGAGCVLRKSAYDHLFRIGYKPILTDRLASALSSGGDYEICYALALLGYDIWYDERLTFMHFMVKERQTWEYYLRYLKESSACFEVLDAYNILINQGTRSELMFNYRFLKGFLYYVQEIALLTLKKATLKPSSNAGKINSLLFLGYKTRLLGYGKYCKVRKNFLRLLQFTNEKLTPPVTPDGKPLYSTQELNHNLL